MIILNVASSQNCLLFILWRKENSFYTLHAIVNKWGINFQHIFQESPQVRLLMKINIIIWDKTPMTNNLCFEAFYQTWNVL